jgi:hypothetical protein
MKLNHFANNPDFIMDMFSLSYEQRQSLFTQLAASCHGPNPLKGKDRKKAMAVMYGIFASWATDPDPTVQCKAEIAFQKIRLHVLEAAE